MTDPKYQDETKIILSEPEAKMFLMCHRGWGECRKGNYEIMVNKSRVPCLTRITHLITPDGKKYRLSDLRKLADSFKSKIAA